MNKRKSFVLYSFCVLGLSLMFISLEATSSKAKRLGVRQFKVPKSQKGLFNPSYKTEKDTIRYYRNKRKQQGGLRQYQDYAKSLAKIRLILAEHKDALLDVVMNHPKAYEAIRNNIFDSMGEWNPVPHLKKYRKK